MGPRGLVARPLVVVAVGLASAEALKAICTGTRRFSGMVIAVLEGRQVGVLERVASGFAPQGRVPTAYLVSSCVVCARPLRA